MAFTIAVIKSVLVVLIAHVFKMCLSEFGLIYH